MGKPVLISYTKMPYGTAYTAALEEHLAPIYNEGIDGVLMETFVLEDHVYDAIEQL